MTPKGLLRLASTAEAITWALLLAGMWLKYGPAQNGLGVAIAGSLHGAAFLAYLFVGFIVGTNQRFRWRELILGGLSSIAPFATIPYDRWVERRGLLEGDWRRASVDFGAADDVADAHDPDSAPMPRATAPTAGPGGTGAAGDSASAAPAIRRTAPLDRFLPVVTWSRYHPFTLGSMLLMVAALILTSALESQLGA